MDRTFSRQGSNSSSIGRNSSFSFDGNESFFELAFKATASPVNHHSGYFEFPTLAAESAVEKKPKLAVGGVSPAKNKVFDEGERILSPNKFDGSKSTRGIREAEEVARNAGSAKLTSGGPNYIETFEKKSRQNMIETRKISLLARVLEKGSIKQLMKPPVQRIMRAFKSEPKQTSFSVHGARRLQTPPPMRPSQSHRLRRVWTPIYNWFTSKRSSKHNTKKHTKIVEINGQGKMLDVLEDIKARSVPSSPRHPNSGDPSRSGVILIPVEPPGWRTMDSQVTVGSAIRYCKRSYGD